MPDLPRHIRLAAGDYFMHGQDHRMRRAGLPGNVCWVKLRLAAGLDVALLRERVAASPILDWLARVDIVRPLGMLPPLWRRAAQPRPILFEHDSRDGDGEGPDSLPPAARRRHLHADRGPALALDLVRHPDLTSRLILSWNHALMDARGAELILRHLNEGMTAKGAPAIENLIKPDQRGWSLSGWWQSVKIARGSVKWLNESGGEPLFSLMPAGPASACRNHYRVLTFSEQETARIDARCQLLTAGFRRSHFFLAASLRALHAIATRRGNQTGAYLVPVPHDTRRRGANGPIFSNHLSILFYRIEPRLAGRLSDILGELSRQMTDQIRTKFPECCMAALDMFKPLPLGFYVNHLGKPTRGKFATFCFSDSGETCAGMSKMLGGPIQSVSHQVATWRPPGLTVLFWTFSGRICAQLSWVDDCLSLVEVDRLEQDLRSALLEEAVS
jgi:hypothetical protein